MDQQLNGLLDDLCRTRGYRKNFGGKGEGEIAAKVADLLSQFPWLTVMIEEVEDGIFNVLALDGMPEYVDLIIVGHLDTVSPSPAEQWTREEFSTDDDGNYYVLGAADARSGIAACLDAIKKTGPTRGVAYLFYGDEETNFVGMEAFVKQHPDLSPRYGLSLCGGYGQAYVGWRGCTEMEFLFEGRSAHASRPHEGANAGDAASVVMAKVRDACMAAPTKQKTSANIAALHAGSGGGLGDFKIGEKSPPPMNNIANKVPDVAWALIDVRTGGPEVSPAFIEGVARGALQAWNEARPESPNVVLRQVFTTFSYPGYLADREAVQGLVDTFNPVHRGKIKDPETTGFIDVTLISDACGTQFMCLSPRGGNIHSPDEWVDLESMAAYRDSCMKLLEPYRIEST